MTGLIWSWVIGLCTDGAAAMTGIYSGVAARIRKVAHANLQVTHCMIHREMLASKQMVPELNDVLSSCIKVVNLIKASALNSRIFKVLCTEMGAEHVNLLLHTEVRWLSRGKVLLRLFELRDEVKCFLVQKQSHLADLFTNPDWIAKLAYMADMFGILNELNLQLQGPMMTAFSMATKIDAFKKKLLVWKKRIDGGIFDMFHCFTEITENTQCDLILNSNLVSQHLELLEKKFEQYFPKENDPRIGFLWVMDPFLHFESETNLQSLSISEQDRLATDPSLKELFKNLSFDEFWLKASSEYEELSKKAVIKLIQFPSTYLCEQAFSSMTTIKTRQRSRLGLEAPLRLAVSKITPRIEMLVNEMQPQNSH